MHDPASNVSLHGMINSIISESTWGALNISENLQSSKDLPLDSWTIVSSSPTRDPPFDGLISYGEFLETRTNLSRPERKALKTTFTEPGKIGDRFRSSFDELMAHMTPEESSSHHYILPSFYRFLSTLHDRGIDYRVIFRTFGTDALEVAEDYNSYCLGRHHTHLNSTDMTHRTLLPSRFGQLKRSTENVILESISPSIGNSVDDEVTQPFSPVIGGKNIYDFLYATLKSDTHAFSIRDDFPYWNSCGESDDSGKLLLIDNNHEDNEICQIFFDDNIERDRAHIVDVRDVTDCDQGIPIPFTASNGRYLCRVSPLEIISDELYFIKEFDKIMAIRGISF